MEIDMRRLRLIRKYCDKAENIRECLKASELTHMKYSGKDERNYNPTPIDWAEFAHTMAEANGACPYGAYSHLVEHHIPSDCRVYRWKPDAPMTDEDDSNDDDDGESDDSDYR